MKRIINTQAPAVITTQHTPLTCVLSIVQVDNQPVTQAQDSTRGLWNPDRTVYPLILAAQFEAYDPDLDIRLSPSVEVSWYVNSKTETWNSSTESGKVQTDDATANYYLEKSNGVPTGRLIVRKNVSYTAPVRIYCVVSYLDSSRSHTYTEEAQVALTTENKPDEFYNVDILTPDTVEYRPLVDESTHKTFKARVTLGNQILAASVQAALKFFWYIDGVLITAGTPGYVSGQGTDTLVLDADYLDKVQVTVKIGSSQSVSSPNINCVCSRQLAWKWPKVSALCYTGGSAVKVHEGSKHFNSIVKDGNLDMDDVKRMEYVRLNWKLKSTATNVVTDLGWGNEMIVPAASLRQGTTANAVVFIEPCLRGAYEKVTTASGELVTTASGEQVYARG